MYRRNSSPPVLQRERWRRIGWKLAARFMRRCRRLYRDRGIEALQIELGALEDRQRDRERRDWARNYQKIIFVRRLVWWLQGEAPDPHSLLEYWFAYRVRDNPTKDTDPITDLQKLSNNQVFPPPSWDVVMSKPTPESILRPSEDPRFWRRADLHVPLCRRNDRIEQPPLDSGLQIVPERNWTDEEEEPDWNSDTRSDLVLSDSDSDIEILPPRRKQTDTTLAASEDDFSRYGGGAAQEDATSRQAPVASGSGLSREDIYGSIRTDETNEGPLEEYGGGFDDLGDGFQQGWPQEQDEGGCLADVETNARSPRTGPSSTRPVGTRPAETRRSPSSISRFTTPAGSAAAASKKSKKRRAPQASEEGQPPTTTHRKRPLKKVDRTELDPAVSLEKKKATFVLGRKGARGKTRQRQQYHHRKARSSFKKMPEVVARPDHPFSEERLIDNFSLRWRHRPLFNLQNFKVVYNGADLATADFADLAHLFNDARYDIVIYGEARPSRLRNDEDDEGNGMSTDEGEGTTTDFLDVTVFGRFDRPHLTFDRTHGLVLETRLARYVLYFPNPLYVAYVAEAKRLLNVWLFARSRLIRGGFGRAVNVGNEIRRQLDRVRTARSQQGQQQVNEEGESVDTTLEFHEHVCRFWRLFSYDDIIMHEKDDELMHETLSNSPWARPPPLPLSLIPPKEYKLIYCYFPPGTFRTAGNVQRLIREAEEERARTEKLVKKYEQRATDDKNSDDTKFSAGRRVDARFYHPRRATGGAKLLVDVFDSLLVESRTIRPGDVLQLRPAVSEPHPTRAEPTSEADGESSDEEDEPPLPLAEPVAPSLWFGKFLYVFRRANDPNAKLQAHVQWLTAPTGIPSLGNINLEPRQFFLLDSCDSFPVDSILSVVDKNDFRFLSPRDPTPSRGFYSWSTYSVDDGSFSDIPKNSPTTTCSSIDIESCPSCESSAILTARTELDVKENRLLHPRHAVDALFSLNGVAFHRNDFVTIHEIEEGRTTAPEIPLRLARLIETDETLERSKVEWIVRATETQVYGKDDFRSEREVLFSGILGSITTSHIDGKFSILHLTDEQVASASDLYEVEDPADQLWTRRCPSTRRQTSAVDGADVVEMCEDSSGIEIDARMCSPLMAAELEAASCTVCCKAYDEVRRERAVLARALLQRERAKHFQQRLMALYAGGGLLDLGLKEGNQCIELTHAVEKHAPAAALLRSNTLDSPTVEVGEVSDTVERSYHVGVIPSRRPHFISGGSPCQGFSTLNRFKKDGDLRCLEPFVYLGSLSVYRPVSALHENVAAFLDFALPPAPDFPDQKRNTFSQLWFSVALQMRYQLRWTVDNAAAFGAPQDRRRAMFQLATTGSPLPGIAKLTHSVLHPRKQFSHALTETNETFQRDPNADVALHPSTNVGDAFSDLPSFNLDECFEEVREEVKKKNADGTDTVTTVTNIIYTSMLLGPEWGDGKAGEYASAARNSLQLRYRMQRICAGGQTHFVLSALTHHVTPPIARVTAERIRGLGKKGNYEDLEHLHCKPSIPDWLTRRSKNKLARWWSRLKRSERSSPLRTTLGLDGASQGPRIHYRDARSISIRECLRLQGVPDGVECLFLNGSPDASCYEALKVTGNGVPIPLGRAYGRASHEAFLPHLRPYLAADAFAPSANVFDKFFAESDHLVEAASAGEQIAYRAQQDRIRSPSPASSSDELDSTLASSPSRSPSPLPGPSRTRPRFPTESRTSSFASTKSRSFSSTIAERESTRPTSVESSPPASTSRKGKEREQIDLDSIETSSDSDKPNDSNELIAPHDAVAPSVSDDPDDMYAIPQQTPGRQSVPLQVQAQLASSNVITIDDSEDDSEDEIVVPFEAASVSKANVLKRIDALAVRLRRRQLIGSREVALEVIRLLREVVAQARFNSFDQLTTHLEEVGRTLQDAGPKELVVTNMTRRVCQLIREEYATALTNHLVSVSTPSGAQTPGVPATPYLSRDIGGSFFTEHDLQGRTRGAALGSIFDLLGHKPTPEGSLRGSPSGFGAFSGASTPATSNSSSPIGSPSSSQILQRPNPLVQTPFSAPFSSDIEFDFSQEKDFSKRSFILKPVFIDAIQELLDEVELTYRSVGEQSLDHIHSGEFILTIGHSKTVEAFLKNAARKRKFTVIVAETAPSFSGRATALALSSAGIPTILIPDSNIFALLPRCTKVLLGPHLVLADGALLSIAGSLPLCLAANRMRVPVVVVGGMFKFSPIYLAEADWGMRDLGSPEEVLKEVEEGFGAQGEEGEEETEVLNPYYDVVPAELVNLYISNLGGHPSSLLYRLLNDMYGSS